jgi:hypothetical protein
MNPTKELNAALAKFQATLPHITKGESATIPGKEGKQGFKYTYADLKDVSDAILPALGKVGLAFSAFPGIVDGKMALVYSLMHESGEERIGVWPLPTGEPRAIGSAITYARRYSLLAVTGVFPGGEDDDGAAAGDASVSQPRESFDDASPVRSNGHQNGSPANGTVARPPAREQPASNGEIDPEAQEFANEIAVAMTVGAAEKIAADARTAGKHGALVRNPDSGKPGILGKLIQWKHKQLEDAEKALTELHRAAEAQKMTIDAIETHVVKVTGASIDDATAAQLRQAAEALTVAQAAA